MNGYAVLVEDRLRSQGCTSRFLVLLLGRIIMFQ